MARDTGKFLELLKPHYNNALNYARALCAKLDASIAEDVMQESLLRALENIDSLKDESRFRSWFFTIVTREFYTHLRKRFWKRFLPVESHASICEMPEVYSRHEQNEDRMLINLALGKLSAKERSAILLFEIAGLSIEEITGIQNERSLSAVKSRLSRAREKLRKYITELEKKGSKIHFQNSNNFEGDLTNETIKLITEIESGK